MRVDISDSFEGGTTGGDHFFNVSGGATPIALLNCFARVSANVGEESGDNGVGREASIALCGFSAKVGGEFEFAWSESKMG